MSSDIEDQNRQIQDADMSNESHKKFKISYTRDFLLSFSELDICKKLPSGFDQSILSEFEDTSQDRFRISGSLSSQNFRRNECGSSPPTRGDVSNYSRGIHGRWDSRSSGRSDRDSDSQSDKDSDSGKRYVYQSRRPWQVPEHDGLLGSGSFPRPTGYGAGVTAPKFRANDHYSLNKSNEPYHPPRPYKAVPHSRRDTDSYNDETFGSSEFTSEDRAEEERKRRASFEMMRKEQQKAFQEKQKLNPEKGKDDFDISLLLEDSKNEKIISNKSKESDDPVVQPVSTDDSHKSSFPSSSPVSRPLVPPGFSSTMVEKNFETKSLTHNFSEVKNEPGGNPLYMKANCFSDGASNQEEKQSLEQTNFIQQHLGSPSINDKSESILNISSALDFSSKTVGTDGPYRTSKLSEDFKIPENSEALEIDAKDVAANNLLDKSSPSPSTSILEKLFGSAVMLNGSGASSFIEHQDVKADDMWSPCTVQSSKFAQWFDEEEKKPVDELTSDEPKDLLSLIVGGEKDGSQVLEGKSTEQIAPKSLFKSPESADVETFENVDKLEAVPAVLTCEDLEQSILLEVTENGPDLIPALQSWTGPDAKTEQQKPDIDDHASHHLLSLLQNGIGVKNTAPSPNLGIRPDKLQGPEVGNLGTVNHISRETVVENISNSGKPLTLETLFGTAFMKELQSVGAPAPGQRASMGSGGVDGSESYGLPFPIDDGIHPSSAEIPTSMSSHGSSVSASNQRQQMKFDRFEENLSGFDSRSEVDLLRLQTELGSNLGGFDGPVQLPEEDNLITASDPLNLQNFVPARKSGKAELLSSMEMPVDITEKLAALESAIREERPVIGGQHHPPFLHGPYDLREPDVQYQNLHVQSSNQPHQLNHDVRYQNLHVQSSNQPHQLNHARPTFHPLNSHPGSINGPMKFMGADNIIHRDGPVNHQFPGNLIRPTFHHPSSTFSGFDPTPHNPMLQQMHITGNFPPPHLLQGFPRGPPLPSHPSNQVTGFIQEPHPIQGFPFGQSQPNFGGLGIPPHVPDVAGRTNHPEALQRLMEMELRSNPKQMHPFGNTGNGRGMYGHELDMGFGFR